MSERLLPNGYEARAARRAEVENLLIRRRSLIDIAFRVSEQFGVSVGAVRQDIHLVKRRWGALLEGRRGVRLLAANLRTMDWAIEQAIEAGDYAEAAVIADRQLKRLGYGPSTKVFVDARQQAVVVNGSPHDRERIEVLRRIAKRLETLAPEELRRALAPPAIEAASGNGANGHAESP